MPLYRYQCEDCKVEFEKLMSMRQKTDTSLEVICPSCGSLETRSVMHKTSFALKGGGWYKEGYQREPQ